MAAPTQLGLHDLIGSCNKCQTIMNWLLYLPTQCIQYCIKLLLHVTQSSYDVMSEVNWKPLNYRGKEVVKCSSVQSPILNTFTFDDGGQRTWHIWSQMTNVKKHSYFPIKCIHIKNINEDSKSESRESLNNLFFTVIPQWIQIKFEAYSSVMQYV